MALPRNKIRRLGNLRCRCNNKNCQGCCCRWLGCGIRGHPDGIRWRWQDLKRGEFIFHGLDSSENLMTFVGIILAIILFVHPPITWDTPTVSALKRLRHF